MLMKTALRRMMTANQFMARKQMPNLLAATNFRTFAVARYHFDEKDFEPTATQVSPSLIFTFFQHRFLTIAFWFTDFFGQSQIQCRGVNQCPTYRAG